MVQYSPLDRQLGAIADPTRRVILDRLGHGSATISELARPLGISLTGVKKHVQVLERADLVTTAKVGRERRCALGPAGLDEIDAWLRSYRRMLETSLDRFGELIEEQNAKEKSDE